jgi:hypothetical protein
MIPFPLVRVTWLDAGSVDEWSGEGDTAPIFHEEIETFGRLVAQDAKYIQVASTIGPADPKTGRKWDMTNLMNIPRGCIVDVQVVMLQPAEEDADALPIPSAYQPLAAGAAEVAAHGDAT